MYSVRNAILFLGISILSASMLVLWPWIVTGSIFKHFYM